MRLSVAWSTRRLLATAALVGGLLCAGLPATAYAASTTGPDYEMPFPCAQSWTGSSRYNHSPSALSIDWNRTNDLGAPMMAAAPGVVTKVSDLGSRSYGRYIIVDHGAGRTTLYAHLLTIWTTLGQKVDQGTLIGRVGSTGGSTGPHLHFEERLNGKVLKSYFHRKSFKMGSTLASQSCSDTPVVGDWDGRGGANVGVLRRSARPQFVLKRPGKATAVVTYGQGGDEPVAGDWDGNKVADVGVRRPASKAFFLRNGNGTTTRITFGQVVGVGIAGDWDGNGRSEVGLWNPSSRMFSLRSATGAVTKITLGAVGDRPLTGDWNGDKRTDIGVYSARTRTFTLRTLPKSGAATTTKVVLGTSTSMPVAGDWNGDKRADVGVWDPATGKYSLRVTPAPTARTAASMRYPVWGLARG